MTVIKHLNLWSRIVNTQRTALEEAGQGIQCLHGSIIAFNQVILTPLDSLKANPLRWLSPLILRKRLCGSLQKEECACARHGDLSAQPMVRGIDGGFLIQDEDTGADGTLEACCQRRRGTFTGTAALWKMVTKHLKSNATFMSESEKGFKLKVRDWGIPIDWFQQFKPSKRQRKWCDRLFGFTSFQMRSSHSETMSIWHTSTGFERSCNLMEVFEMKVIEACNDIP